MVRATVNVPPTSFGQVDAIATRLANHKHEWVKVDIPQRINLLQQCIRGVLAVAQEWVAASCNAKGLATDSNLAGEEWLTGPLATLMNLNQLIRALEAGGQPQPPQWRQCEGQTIAKVFPANLAETLLWWGCQAEVWLQPGHPPTQGTVYRNKNHPGRLALVLGAGNIAAIAPTDSLYKLFAEDQVVLLKMNPVNDYLGPLLHQAFASLIQAGYFELVYGGAELGQYLCQHPLVDTIHITGSQQTHDRIVWGDTPIEQAQRKAEHRPRLDKPISSELGNITPVLVVPGPWSAADLRLQARHVASMVVHNASFNCVAGKLLITAQGWEQEQDFLQQVHQELAQTPHRRAYYPGAQSRYQQWLQHYPHAQPLGQGSADTIPWTVIPSVPAQKGEYALSKEAFCGVLSEVSLPASEPAAFLQQAIALVNEQVWGTLGCTLLLHPTTQKQLGASFIRAIAALRYGNIGVNVWVGANFLLGVTSWGAFPGNPLTNIGSGQGIVHNTYLFDHPQKSVLYAPFHPLITPAWFHTHKSLRQLGQELVQYEANRSWSNFLRVLWAGLQG
uniref:Aldehyde dehydrogenase domain-containing protein n=1 Tax=Cyanothece sp. (strain PCC 7425 / ATCC 29141) TaxID=395961 RepID=B8HMI0_CYAP4